MKSINGTQVLLAVSLLMACVCWNCDAFGLNAANNSAKVSSTPTTSRQNFLAAMAGGLLTTATLTSPAPVWAKDDGGSYTKGSKNDPAVQAKLSVCMYECTKPKGSEQMSRAECLPKCKKECITSK